MEILSVCKKIRAGPVLTPRRAYTLSTVEYTPMGGQICHFDLPPMMHRVVTGLSPATRSHVDATSCREMHSSQMALAEPSALQHGRTYGNNKRTNPSKLKPTNKDFFKRSSGSVCRARLFLSACAKKLHDRSETSGPFVQIPTTNSYRASTANRRPQFTVGIVSLAPRAGDERRRRR